MMGLEIEPEASPRSRPRRHSCLLSRRMLLGTTAAAAGTALAALPGCAVGGAEPAQRAVESVRIRTLTRIESDTPAWTSFNESSAGVRIEMEAGPDTTAAYGAKVLSLAAAGALPDVIYTHPNFFSSLASIKALADLTPLASRARFDLRGIQQELLDSVRWDGVLYSLPYGGVANLVVYNAGQFQKRGVPLPPDQIRANTWTWEGFRDTLRRLTVRAPGQPPEAGMPEHFRGLQYQSQWVFGAGGQVWSKDNKRCLLDGREAQAGLDFLAQLHHKEQVSIQPDEAADFGGSIQEGFPTGRVGLRFRATTELYLYRQMAQEGARLGVASIPRGPAGVTPRGAANSWGISAQSAAPEVAWKAIAAWHGDPVLKTAFTQRAIFPCRQSQFDHPAFKASLLPWEDVEVERAALRDVRIMATPARFTEIDALWGRLWVQARDGKKSVKDLVAEFLPAANALLGS